MPGQLYSLISALCLLANSMTVHIESYYGYFIDSSFLITLYLRLCLSGLPLAVYLQNKLSTDIYNKITF